MEIGRYKPAKKWNIITETQSDRENPLSFELNCHQISMNHITKAYLGFPGITNPECPLGSSAIAIDYDFKTKKVLAYSKKKKKKNH